MAEPPWRRHEHEYQICEKSHHAVSCSLCDTLCPIFCGQACTIVLLPHRISKYLEEQGNFQEIVSVVQPLLLRLERFAAVVVAAGEK